MEEALTVEDGAGAGAGMGGVGITVAAAGRVMDLLVAAVGVAGMDSLGEATISLP
jgi:hypothetical protein